MPLFRKAGMVPEQPDNPTPGTSETPPSSPEGAETPPSPEYVPKEDFEALKKTNESLADQVEKLSLRIENFGQPQPATPAAPAGPSPSEKIKDRIDNLNTEIKSLTKQIDDAYTNAQPIGELTSKKDDLISERAELRAELRLRPEIDQLQLSGTRAIEQLTDSVTAGNMPYLTHPKVKQSYDEMLNQLPANQRISPQVRMQVYNYAVGSHHEELTNLKIEEATRAAAETTVTQTPGTTTGRETQTAAAGEIPKPEDVLSRDNLDAIQASGKTIDAYYHSLGYKGGWEEFWKETGKDYFEEGEVA